MNTWYGYRYSILLTTWLMYSVFYLNRQNLSAMAPLLIQDLGLSYTQMGLIMSCFFATYALSQFPSGYLGDRIGPRKTITLGGLTLAGANLLFGSSSSIYHLLAAQSINGWGQAAGWAPSIKLITNWFREHGKTTALGVFMTSVPVSITIAYIFSGWLGANFGWRFAFFVPALIMFFMVLIFRLVVRDFPQEKHRSNIKPSDEKILRFKDAFSSVLLSGDMWRVGFTFSCVLFTFWGIVMWMPTYIVETVGFGIEKAVLLSSIIPLGGLFSRLFAGLIVDRLLGGRKKQLIFVCFVFLIPIVYLIPQAQTVFLLAFLLFLAGFFVQMPFPLIFSYPSELLSERLVGSGSGFLDALGQSSSVVSMYLTGFLLDLFHTYEPVFTMYIMVLVVGMFSTLLIREKVG